MVNIIKPREVGGVAIGSKSENLDELVRQAFLVCENKPTCSQEGLDVIASGQLGKIFESKLNQEIFTREIISDNLSDIFLCGMYVAALLTNLASTNPDSWWAIDYATSDEPSVLKKGGDVCFIICGVFPKRGNYRMASISYYQMMGAGFYHKYYALSKKEIGYHMSNHFGKMADIVKSCIHSI